MASSLLPYVGLEEVKGDTVGCAKSILAEFIGTMFLVRIFKASHIVSLKHFERYLLSVFTCFCFIRGERGRTRILIAY